MKNCCIYARVSSILQDIENSVAAQVKACRDYAESQKYHIIEVYIDKAESGTSSNRPEFQRMITDAKKKNFEVILVHKLDRFARNREDAVTYKALLRRHKVELYSISEALGDDIYSRLIEGILEVVAEFYSLNLGQEVRKGQAEVASQGFVPNGPIPVGYKRVRLEKDQHTTLEPDPDVAPVIQQVFKMSAEGKHLEILIEFLNSKLKSPRGKNWNISHLCKILKSRLYLGERSYNGVVKVDAHPALISEELYEKAQRKKRENWGRKINARIFPLSGLMICDKCKRAFVGGSSLRGNCLYKYYICSSYNGNRICYKKRIRAEKIEGIVKDIVIKELGNIDLEKYKKTGTGVSKQVKKKEIKELKQKIIELENERDNIIKAICKGYEEDLFKVRLNEISELIKSIKEQIEIKKNEPEIKLEAVRGLTKVREIIPAMSEEKLKKFAKEI